jgi:hypothetical protein
MSLGLMLATDRLFEVIEKFGKLLQRVVPVFSLDFAQIRNNHLL